MSDIVERLRDYINHDEDEWLEYMLEAAAEIERLRADLKVKRAIIDERRAREMILQIELEQLRAALKAIADYPYNAPNLIRAVARIELERALEPKP